MKCNSGVRQPGRGVEKRTKSAPSAALSEFPSPPTAHKHGNHNQDSFTTGIHPCGMASSNAPPHAHVVHRQASARGKQRINHLSQHLTVVSANVRGLRTNLGDLTHNFVLRHQADIVAVTETWLNGEVEPTFGNIPGYLKSERKA
ncbi:hypothetical protein E2C01_002323 [Portunus trituberculatus]|uniref:RNA-directed DNA polymerase from mobile element jockey n=1 Tax=Portunus trituberculatus TaxID=210409 RepID=A0A5B7CKA0_PORTR|nr:hypothetical protein [Portunus trituberculatus]